VYVHGAEELDAMDGMLGLADLLTGIREEIVNLSGSR